MYPVIVLIGPVIESESLIRNIRSNVVAADCERTIAVVELVKPV